MPRIKTSRNIMMALPYVAVLIGLYLYRSAWFSILLYHGGIVLFFLLTRPTDLWRHLFSGWRSRPGLGASLLCAGCGPIFVLLWPMIGRESVDLGSSLTGFGLAGASWYLFAAYYVILHPILEEAFWRDRRFVQGKGLTLSDAAFAGYHFLVLLHFIHPLWALISVAVLIFMSGLWRRMAERFQGLAIPIISHSVASMSIMAAVYFLIRNQIVDF